MNNNPKLNFPTCPLRLKQKGDCTYVWDELRGQWLMLTPEEWVRRHLIAFLCNELGADKMHVMQEYPVFHEGRSLRADVVVLGHEIEIEEKNAKLKPLMLIECKAPDVAIDQSTLVQAFYYNRSVGARYLMLTNGLTHFLYESCGDMHYRKMKTFPDLKIPNIN